MSNVTINTLNTPANSDKLANKQTKPNNHTNRYGGFTIIELLIVIVIIGVLVAITAVAYTGIVNSANDTSVQVGVRNLANAINVWEVQNDDTAILSGTSIGPGLTFSPNKEAHYETYALYVCRKTSDTSNFVVASRSKSGKIFAYKVGGGPVDYPAGGLSDSWGAGGTNCPRMLGENLGSSEYTYSYGRGSGNSWASWVK